MVSMPEPSFHDPLVKEYLKWMRRHRGLAHYLGPNYLDARRYVLKRMKKLSRLISEIRAKGQSISKIDPKTLKERLKPIDTDIVERLCSVFPRYEGRQK